MVKNNEQAIREAAYFIWQNAGCPQGQDEYFWSMAVEQFNNKSSSAKASSAKKCSSSKKCATTSCKTKSSSCKSASSAKKSSK